MKVMTFGELLIRLSAPGYTKLFQTENMQATFCGGEANVAVSLAMFGLDSEFVTTLPAGDIGQAANNALRYFGVNTQKIKYSSGRMGLYYLEKGASQRPSKIIYDRRYSVFSLSKKEDYDWNTIFEDVDWFHWTGITPALSGELPEICLQACKSAREKGITTSCDLNYRKNLWSSEQAEKTMKSLMPYVDVCIANEEDAEKVLGIKTDSNDIEGGNLNKDGYTYVAQKICDVYGCHCVAFTLRESYSASINGWSGMLYSSNEQKSYKSKKYDIQLVDRVGGGDSFSAGLIYALAVGKKYQQAIEFATAASCLKQTIEGDFNRTTVAEVENLLNTGGSGRVLR